eukprot:Filipodium_phascolosomae@DN1022_c0_g1_i1.p1
MSSLAAARADNFYYGKDYGPKDGSLNKYRNSNGALGKRANKLHLGILIIRFEIPFNVRCKNCRTMIAKGVRYNAEKKCVGTYFSTKIYEFAMSCYYCPQKIRITTDPKGRDYILTEGLERKVETWKAEDAEQIELRTEEERELMKHNPMLRLEKTVDDKAKAKKSVDTLEELFELNESRSDHYTCNSILRKRFRQQKADLAKAALELEQNRNFVIPLVDEFPEDIQEAKRQKFKSSGQVSHKPLLNRSLSSSFLKGM